MAKSKGFIAKSQYNPAVQARKLEHLASKIAEQQKIIAQIELTNDLKYNALENFVTLLTAFASHDVKNAVHNMDGIISLLNVENIEQEDVDILKDCISRIRLTLDEFATLGSQKNNLQTESFEVGRLMSSLDVLHRHSLKASLIRYSVIYNVSKQLMISQNLHWLIQLFNNMLINATQALSDSEEKIIQITIDSLDENVIFHISDTGVGIQDDIKEKIFEPYFTTTGGSGVGLAHVVYVLKEINGFIKLGYDPNFSTTFEVVFPIQ